MFDEDVLKNIIEFANCDDIRDKFSNVFHELFVNNGSHVSLSMEREAFFQKLHRMRTSPEVMSDIVSLFLSVGCKQSEIDIRNVIQMIFLELVGEIFRVRLDFEKRQSVIIQKELTANDQSVLFYIAGYIIRSLTRRYYKLKNRDTRVEDCLKDLVVHSKPSENVPNPISSLSDKKNRGGLKVPNDDFYKLVREMEMVTRKLIDENTLNASSLLLDPLRENVMENYMVKHYADRLYIQAGEYGSVLFEKTVKLFLTIRGFAVVRVQRNVINKAKKTTKSSHSLRKTLQSRDTNMRK